MQQKIQFRKERDFGSVFGDSLKFLKQNFKSFFASIVLIAGPFILLMSISYAYIESYIMTNSFSSIGTLGSRFTSNYFMSVGVLLLFWLIVNILLSAVVNHYMALYNEKPFGEPIKVSEVSKRLRDNLNSLVKAAITFFLNVILVIIALVVLGVVIDFSAGLENSITLVLFLVIIAIVVAPIIYYFIPAAFYLVIRDDENIILAFKKVKKYLAGNYLWTWLIMVITLISLGILKVIFNLPASILLVISMFSRMDGNMPPGFAEGPLLTIFYTIGMCLSYCTISISHLISTFNFMSHEEKQEGHGLMSRINEIG